MKEYDLYVPLSYNDGTPIADEKLHLVKRALVEKFGGLTHFPQENEGIWKVGRTTFRDRVVILRVLAEDAISARAFLAQLRARMQEDFRQESVLLIEREVNMMD